jgi:hypothetical protein
VEDIDHHHEVVHSATGGWKGKRDESWRCRPRKCGIQQGKRFPQRFSRLEQNLPRLGSNVRKKQMPRSHLSTRIEQTVPSQMEFVLAGRIAFLFIHSFTEISIVDYNINFSGGRCHHLGL